MRTAEVIIVGGGVIGVSIAYHLAHRGSQGILLLEREELLGTGSTAACAGGFRYQFSSEIHIRLSQLSIPAFLRFREEVGFPLTLHQDGYLFLLTREADVSLFQESLALQRRLGVPVEWLTPEEAGALIPGLDVSDVRAATYGPADGIADPAGVTQGYAAAARRLGVTIETGSEVTDIRVEGGRVRGVRTGREAVAAPVVVNAAGPWAAQVARLAGVSLPVRPSRRHVVTTRPFPGAPPRRTLVIDFASTFYFHRESEGLLFGMSREEPDGFDTSVDPDFVSRIVEIGLGRFPPLGEAELGRTWAGLYEMTPDAHPILGEAAETAGFFLANGFSGHGFQHAPAVGLLLSELILDGKATTLDISPLGPARFAAGPVMAERHVV
ncbi:MAG: FAD-binding oxidoreductase [candidate division NC10 bacterium]|nr:FAD-binding oxidoreductase [candidate division NC10 bacterium]